jgi:hypothetical protein
MITLPFLAPLMGWFRTNPRNVWLVAGLIGVIAVLGGVYLKGRSDNAKQEKARDAIAVAEAIKSDEKADTKAAGQLAHDAAVQAQKEKELANAVADIIDTVPDPVAVRAGCCELQQNGISVADLPACLDASGRAPACTDR